LFRNKSSHSEIVTFLPVPERVARWNAIVHSLTPFA